MHALKPFRYHRLRERFSITCKLGLEAGVALSRYGDNKAKRDQRHKIGPITRLLTKLYVTRKPGETMVLPWNCCLKGLDRTLARIQKAAGIHLPCREDREHTPPLRISQFHVLSRDVQFLPSIGLGLARTDGARYIYNDAVKHQVCGNSPRMRLWRIPSGVVQSKCLMSVECLWSVVGQIALPRVTQLLCFEQLAPFV